jgi:hypothetical protein
MSDWKEQKSEHPDIPADSQKQEDSKEQSDDSDKNNKNGVTEQPEQELQDDIRNREQELRTTPRMISAVQGYDLKEGVSSESLYDTGKEDEEIDSEKNEEQVGIAPLSDKTKSKIYEIINLPVGERKAAMGDFFNSHKNLFGNQTKEGNYLQLDSQIHPGGKGVTIIDEDGIEYEIKYEE